MFRTIHQLATSLYLAVDDRTRRAGVWLVHGIGWPWSIAVVARDVAAEKFHPASLVPPTILAVAGLIQALIKLDQWLFDKAEKRRARGGKS